MNSGPCGLLVLGASCVGKSTCARTVGNTLRWPVVSTDALGRHPGRPWGDVPEPVLEFYSHLTNDAIHWFLKVHHENLRPVIAARLQALCDTGDGFVLEGAALRPEYVAGWDIGTAIVVCLYVEPSALRERIMRESDHARQGSRVKNAIDRFADRSLRENEAQAQAAMTHGIEVIDVTDVESADRAATSLAARLVGDRPRS